MITTITQFKKINESIAEIKTISDFFQQLFTMRQIAHDIHLTKSKYAAHMALDTFYKDILDIIDTLFETYQGQYGLIENYKTVIDYDSENIIQTLEEYTTLIRTSARELIKSEDTHLINIVDEISALSYQTLYKLKYLAE